MVSLVFSAVPQPSSGLPIHSVISGPRLLLDIPMYVLQLTYSNNSSISYDIICFLVIDLTVTRTANISPLNQPRMYVALVLPCRRNNERDSRIARTGDSGCSLHSQPPAGAWGRAERVVAYILQQHSQEKTSCYSILLVRCW